MKLTKDNCTVFRCTQCGKIEYKPFVGKPNDKLSCDCEKAMPWEWIWTKEWAEEYRKQRIALGIDKK